MQEFTIDLKNYKTDGTVFKRAAVRGMIRRDGKLLLIHGMKYGDYKFPGGGKHEEEALLDTLVREVAEETGYRIKRESVEEFMKVTERRKGDPDDLMEMVSWYYVCDVEETAGNRNLDDYEKEYDYRVQWMSLEEAVAGNEKVQQRKAVPWVERETEVMRRILRQQT